MSLDAIVVTLVVGGAVAYLAWSFVPRKKKALPACAACVHDEGRPVSAPVKSPPSR